jgi:hypothetical protein
MMTSLKGWYKSWFYCENHEPSLQPFIGRLPEYQKSWVEEPTIAKLPIVASLARRVSDLKRRGLINVCVVANWLARQVMPLKKYVHPGWEYSGLQDPTQETTDNIDVDQMVKVLEEIFQNTSSWPSIE